MGLMVETLMKYWLVCATLPFAACCRREGSLGAGSELVSDVHLCAPDSVQ